MRRGIAACLTLTAGLAGAPVSAQHPQTVAIISTAAPDGWEVPREADGRPRLQGIWANDSATPLQRPTALGDRATLTDEELAVLRTHAEGVVGGRRTPGRAV